MKRTIVLGVIMIGLSWGSAAAKERDPNRLQLGSVSAAVAPLGTDELEFAKREDWVMPIASITKLMTALVVLESEQPLDEWLPVVERTEPAPANAYSRIRLESQATRRDFLQLALMSSENRAAYLLARHHPGGSETFVAAMNAKAEALGMTRSRFVDSTGLSDANTSTAEDLVKLVNAAYEYPLIRELSTTPGRWANFRAPRYGLQFGNTNPLVHSSRWNVLLSKTGYLDASGRCLVMVVDMDEEPKVVVLLDSRGTRTPLGDAGRIRRWLETGAGGKVAPAALTYEQERAAKKEAELTATAEL